MAVYFMNKGHIDLDVIRTMGVSVKENDNPIGFFGTGLKYSIATLLRTGHKISLKTDGHTIDFRTQEKIIRGKTFQMIQMGDEQLGFTTDLGKNWEVWQAYRELYSNCLDENGKISTIFDESFDTIFSVNGPEIDNIHADRGKIFLQNEPWIVGSGIEIHRGKSDYVYYRGVCVHKLLKPSRFTYNFTCQMTLTEDRTLASTYDMIYKLSARLPRVADPVFCEKIIDPDWDGFETNLDFSNCYDPSEEFLDALEKHRANARMREKNKEILYRHRKVNKWDVFELDDEQARTVASACKMLRALNCFVSPQDFTFVENLGPGIYGHCKDGKMLITRQTIANGRDFLAITMYEEWIHDHLGYKDETRAMQQFLLDKILELIKREN
jgi:hypothetical protein